MALGLAGTATATYIIYTKDGKRIEARDKPVVQGKRLVYVNPLGTQQSIAIDEFDQERSDKANLEGLGNAYLLDDPGGGRSTLVNPTEKKPSLSDYIREHGRKLDDAPEARQGGELVKHRPAASEAAPVSRPPVPESGVVVMDPQITEAFMRALDGSNVKGVKLAQIPSGVRVQATTETEQQVFLALVACARGLKESRASGKALDKAEVVLATSTGEPAGRFDLSPNDAENLLNGKVTPARFYVTSVLF